MKAMFTAKTHPKPMRNPFPQSAQGKRTSRVIASAVSRDGKNKPAVPTTEMQPTETAADPSALEACAKYEKYLEYSINRWNFNKNCRNSLYICSQKIAHLCSILLNNTYLCTKIRKEFSQRPYLIYVRSQS